MPCMKFEATIPASERAKTIHALERSAIVTGQSRQNHNNILIVSCVPGHLCADQSPDDGSLDQNI
jgi:hypothetical protein